MNYKWLNKENNNRLIVFFNGWAMNEQAVEHLVFDDYDILMINDYRDFEFDFSKFDFEIYKEKYNEKYLICWSMGVYISNYFKNIFENFDKKIAINGTSNIIDNNFGIPEKIYNITIKYFNKENLNKFLANMFFDGNISENFKTGFNNIQPGELYNLKDELISIKNIKIKEKIRFDKAIISLSDIIVPTKNQLNFWNNQESVDIIKINTSHYPFDIYKSWHELI